MALGEKIKLVRKRLGYTLQELSHKTNLSVGYLSNIERNATSPTVATLEILCNALRIDIVELMEAARSPSPLQKQSERPRVYADRDGILENAVVENEAYRCTVHTMNPDYKDDISHPGGNTGDILCYQLSGASELDMDGVTYLMEAGDTIFIKANTPHSFRRAGPEKNVTLWIYPRRPRI
ncbi:MAG: XRE family transcriptional regulator [Clostridia bacterium]|nr:XRE family transcriptional regulator [Clostridia bacterium]